MDRDELIKALKHCTLDKEGQCDCCPGEDGIHCMYMDDGSWVKMPMSLVKCAIDMLDSGEGDDYKRGLNDAWDVCRKILLCTDDGGIPLSDIEKIFGSKGPSLLWLCQKLLKEYTAEEVVSKIKEYYDGFHVGDEVVFGGSHINGVVTKITPYGATTLRVLDKNGCVHLVYPASSECKKTGRHLNEVEELLKLIEDGEDEDG